MTHGNTELLRGVFQFLNRLFLLNIYPKLRKRYRKVAYFLYHYSSHIVIPKASFFSVLSPTLALVYISSFSILFKIFNYLLKQC